MARSRPTATPSRPTITTYAFFVGSDDRLAVAQGKAEYIPISIAQVTALFQNRRIAIDTALIQVSLPDLRLCEPGRLGRHRARRRRQRCGASWPRSIQHAPHHGRNFLHVDGIDQFVWADVPVIEYVHEPADEVGRQIARYIAGIIGDGATLQVGLGRIPNEAMRHLNRRDLGIHSDVITERSCRWSSRASSPAGASPSIRARSSPASAWIQRLYQLIDGNPLFSFHPIEYVCDPLIMAKNRQLVSITQAFAVDLTGQVCADQFEGEFYSGVAAQPDFLRAAALSEGGKPIICLPSTTQDDGLADPAPAARGRGRVHRAIGRHYVITEYGIAYLFGRSIRERALALIEIAHPKFRAWLLERGQAARLRAPRAVAESSVSYPIEEERRVALKDGRSVLLRPARASDAKILAGPLL